MPQAMTPEEFIRREERDWERFALRLEREERALRRFEHEGLPPDCMRLNLGGAAATTVVKVRHA